MSLQPSIGFFRKRCLKIRSSKFTGEHPCRSVIQWWWWWWSMMMNFFVVWLTNERPLALFPAGAIVRDPHHRESLTCCEQVRTYAEPEFWLGWMKLCSSDNHNTTAPHNKVALQLYWNRTSAWVFSCKFAAYF